MTESALARKRERDKKYRETHREAINLHLVEYRKKNREKILQYHRLYDLTHKKERQATYKKNKKVMDELRSSGCSICGYNKCLAALDFHHTDQTQKDFVISRLRSESAIRREAKSCIVLCANCHREIHSIANQRNVML